MKASDAGHPVWGVLKVAVICGVAVGALHFNYAGLDSRDAVTVLEIVAFLGGMELWQEKKRRDQHPEGEPMSEVTIERLEPEYHVRGLRGDYGRLNLRDVEPIDADTLRATIEVPFVDMSLLVLRQTIRVAAPDLSPFDTWEIRGKERQRGLVAYADACRAVQSGKCTLLCRGRDKYGRLLGPVEVTTASEVFDFASRMRDLGHDRNAEEPDA